MIPGAQSQPPKNMIPETEATVTRGFVCTKLRASYGPGILAVPLERAFVAIHCSAGQRYAAMRRGLFYPSISILRMRQLQCRVLECTSSVTGLASLAAHEMRTWLRHPPPAPKHACARAWTHVRNCGCACACVMRMASRSKVRNACARGAANLWSPILMCMCHN